MKKFLLFVLCFYTFCTCLCAAEITGKVIKIYDGDTIRIQDADGGKFKVRFADIDAPEHAQIGGDAAKNFLSSLLSEKSVLVKFLTIDQYGRIVGSVYLGNQNINEIMVKNGWAWWYKEYSKNKSFGKLESEARKNKLGIWKTSNPLPPWEYRREQRKKR